MKTAGGKGIDNTTFGSGPPGSAGSAGSREYGAADSDSRGARGGSSDGASWRGRRCPPRLKRPSRTVTVDVNGRPRAGDGKREGQSIDGGGDIIVCVYDRWSGEIMGWDGGMAGGGQKQNKNKKRNQTLLECFLA
jgi:hypothetical protein